MRVFVAVRIVAVVAEAAALSFVDSEHPTSSSVAVLATAAWGWLTYPAAAAAAAVAPPCLVVSASVAAAAAAAVVE